MPRTGARSALTRKGVATRARIVESAAGLIRRHGAVGVTLDDIAAASATGKGQLFHYFPGGREALLGAVAALEVDRVLDDQEPHLSDLAREPEWARWRAWQDATVERYRRLGLDCALGVLVTELGRATPAAQEVTAGLVRRWRSALADGVLAMQRAGHIDDSFDSVEIAGALVTAVQGGAALLVATGSTEHLEAAVDVLFRALGAPPRAPTSSENPDTLTIR